MTTIPSAPPALTQIPQPQQPQTPQQPQMQPQIQQPHPATQGFLPTSQMELQTQTQQSIPLAQSLASQGAYTPQSATLASLANSTGIFQPHQAIHQHAPTPASASVAGGVSGGTSTTGTQTQTSANTTPFSAFSPLSQAATSTTGTSISAQQPPAPAQSLAHNLSQYSQHGLPTHVESPTIPSAQSQHQQLAAHQHQHQLHQAQQQQHQTQTPTASQTQQAQQQQSLGSFYRQHEYGFTPSGHMTGQSLLSQHAAATAAAQQQGGQSLAGVGGGISGQLQQEQGVGGYSAFSNLAQSFQGQDFGGFTEQRVRVYAPVLFLPADWHCAGLLRERIPAFELWS